MRFRPTFVPVLLLLLALPATAQTVQPASSSGNGQLFAQAPRPYEILGLSVEGVADESMQRFVLQSSGLTVGQEVTHPPATQTCPLAH